MKFSIRLLYLYLFSFIGLLIAVIGSIRLVDLGLKVYIFGGADTYSYSVPIVAPDGKIASSSPEYERQMKIQQTDENVRQRKRTMAEALAMIVVGVPLYAYHWSLIKKESKG